MTYGKAALYGFLGGAWFGLLIGILMGIFVPAIAWINVVLWAVVLAGVFGLIWGLISHALTGRERSFHSVRATKASSYTVEVLANRADEALRVLSAGR